MASDKASEMPEGGMITEAGSSRRYLTGDWRSKRPECDELKCTNCLICWIYCPDNSIIVINNGYGICCSVSHCSNSNQ